MSNKMAEKLINFRVYNEGNDLLGVADVDLPAIESMTDTVKGAGIAGEVDSPTLGHYGSMTCTLNWRTNSKAVMELAKPKAHQVELRGAVQTYDSAAGAYETVSQKIVLKMVPKNTSLGRLDVGTGQDTSNEFEVNYIKIFIGGSEVFELDKFNYICKIDGQDFLADTREALGL
jgi:P2 family phage contractile tail tube protein